MTDAQKRAEKVQRGLQKPDSTKTEQPPKEVSPWESVHGKAWWFLLAHF